METITLNQFLLHSLELMAALFIIAMGGLIILIVIVYFIDVRQTKHAIRRNYPVIGRFRYWFEHLGVFFRQYFFAGDREELPFNRADRSWIYRAAKNNRLTNAFGSTKHSSKVGEIIFLNCAFPTLSSDQVEAKEITIGEYSRHPYITRSILNISGMSYGAISKPAVTALSHGAKKAGLWMNTGEGGVSPYHLESGCDLVFQIGTAKYGVRDESGQLCRHKLKTLGETPNIKMFEIKLSQGAKPGKGGILPGLKVTEEIAHIRGIPKGQSSISPNAHPEFKCVDDILDMIELIRNITGKPVGLKAVIGLDQWLTDLFQAIHQRGIQSAPDFFTIDGGDGGTGAAPESLMDSVGLNLKESLPLFVDRLNQYELRDRIKVICSGKMITPSWVAWALCMGADFVVSARGFMFAIGCIQAMQCNKNTCPTGITTHNTTLQKGLDPTLKANRVANYATHLMHEVGVIAHSCGVNDPRELKRHHVRIVMENGYSVPASELFPEYQKSTAQ